MSSLSYSNDGEDNDWLDLNASESEFFQLEQFLENTPFDYPDSPSAGGVAPSATLVDVPYTSSSSQQMDYGPSQSMHLSKPTNNNNNNNDYTQQMNNANNIQVESPDSPSTNIPPRSPFGSNPPYIDSVPMSYVDASHQNPNNNSSADQIHRMAKSSSISTRRRNPIPIRTSQPNVVPPVPQHSSTLYNSHSSETAFFSPQQGINSQSVNNSNPNNNNNNSNNNNNNNNSSSNNSINNANNSNNNPAIIPVNSNIQNPNNNNNSNNMGNTQIYSGYNNPRRANTANAFPDYSNRVPNSQMSAGNNNNTSNNINNANNNNNNPNNNNNNNSSGAANNTMPMGYPNQRFSSTPSINLTGMTNTTNMGTNVNNSAMNTNVNNTNQANLVGGVGLGGGMGANNMPNGSHALISTLSSLNAVPGASNSANASSNNANASLNSTNNGPNNANTNMSNPMARYHPYSRATPVNSAPNLLSQQFQPLSNIPGHPNSPSIGVHQNMNNTGMLQQATNSPIPSGVNSSGNNNNNNNTNTNANNSGITNTTNTTNMNLAAKQNVNVNVSSVVNAGSRPGINPRSASFTAPASANANTSNYNSMPASMTANSGGTPNINSSPVAPTIALPATFRTPGNTNNNRASITVDIANNNANPSVVNGVNSPSINGAAPITSYRAYDNGNSQTTTTIAGSSTSSSSSSPGNQNLPFYHQQQLSQNDFHGYPLNTPSYHQNQQSSCLLSQNYQTLYSRSQSSFLHESAANATPENLSSRYQSQTAPVYQSPFYQMNFDTWNGNSGMNNNPATVVPAVGHVNGNYNAMNYEYYQPGSVQ